MDRDRNRSIVIGFSFLDRYAPLNGLAWNVINGKIDGLAYKYVFAIGVLLILFSGWLWARRPQHAAYHPCSRSAATRRIRSEQQVALSRV